ncbi:MAG: acetate--CoA ligase family protein [Clostridia bacterium]|nr:acetate--CoA ligase family protein [Clostridia bacterium]
MQFSDNTISSINSILREAYLEERNTLFEYEVYKILKCMGLEVPEFILVEDPLEVNAKMLKNFEHDIVVKIISPQISHKQKLGGVKIIKNWDPLYIQFVLSRMKEEVLSHFPENDKPEIKGFLIVQYIPHTQSLGYEILIGFKEDHAFGPVLTLSKGGDDAEFFAKFYDPANLFLPLLNYGDALKVMDTLKIKHKFGQIGHPEYLEYIAKAASLIGYLAYRYSFIPQQKPQFIIKAFEINPFAISHDDRFVAIDGFAQFIPYDEERKVVRKNNLDHMDAFFKPEGIAVIGVSSKPEKFSIGRDIARLLHDLGRDDLYFVNIKGGSVAIGEKEYPLYKSFQDIPDKVDLVVYAAPAQYTVDFIRELPRNGPRAVILISGIPSNVKYAEFVKQLDSVKPQEVRIIGPNCMGVYYAPSGEHKGIDTLFIDEKRLELKASSYSNTVLLTQSGGLAITAIDKLQKSGLFKSVVSFGNQYDIKITDLIDYFSKDPAIDVIALYVEGFDDGEGREFYELAGKTIKPIIVYKAGKTEAGARAAASHTASMSGSYDVFKAACRQADIILAENIEDNYNYIKIFSLLAHKIPSGNRVAGVVNAGFESTVGADELKNLKQAELSLETVKKLNAINNYGLVDTSTPILDVTAMADDKAYADFVEAILEDEGVDCVFVAIVPHVVALKTTPETCHDPDSLANLLVSLSQKYKKPIVVSVNAGRYYEEFVSIMEESGLPVYPDIRSAIKSLDTFVTYHERLG